MSLRQAILLPTLVGLFTIGAQATSIVVPSGATITYGDYNSATNTFADSVPFGVQNYTAGTYTYSGPAYGNAQLFYPNTQNATNPDVTLLHPGTFNSLSYLAVLTIADLAPGTYQISGAFARANNARLAGDGVNVLAFVNAAISTPLYANSISSNHDVNPNALFSGTGVATFNFTTTLNNGNLLRFAVGPGLSGTDGTFDLTALNLTIEPTAVPEPATVGLTFIAVCSIATLRRRRA